MPPAAFHILVALAGGSRHGYGIMKEVTAATDGEVRLNAGTLYTTIRRLLEDGLIKEVAGERGSDERRRYYVITKDGRAAAEAELDRLQAMTERATATLRSKPAR